MEEEEMKEKVEVGSKSTISRRQFLKDAGLVVGGATVGSMAILSACGETKTITNTSTVTNTSTITSTVGAGSTVTVTSPPTTVSVNRYICPLDNQEFATLAELKAHLEANHLGAEATNITTLTVNGDTYGFVDLKPYTSLLHVLREKLGLFGAKEGCNMGECGSCTVLMNGKPVNSCLVLAIEADGASIETIEGLSDGITLSPVQQIFYDKDALQCGYCAPGIIMSATALKKAKANPTLDEVREALSGHICTCGNLSTYMAALLDLRKGG